MLTTLTLGVLSLYAALFLVTLAAVGLIIDSDLLAQQLRHPVGLGDYLALACMASSLAAVGGALGSGLESESVRAGACGLPPQPAQGGR